MKQIIYKVLDKLKDNALNAVHPQPFPIGVSNRHVHLSKDDLEALFGKGYELKVNQKISQPGQFAANETVNLAGPKGYIEKVRILGPLRKHTQVEIMRSDKYKLGVAPPLRESGDIKDSSGITIIGPMGSIHIKEGLIISRRHVHMTPADAAAYGVSDGETVQVRAGTGRGLIFDQVVIRVRDDFALELHIDMDEANAAEVENGDQASLLIGKSNMNALGVAVAHEKSDMNVSGAAMANEKSSLEKIASLEALSLVTEDIVRQAWKSKTVLHVKKGYMVTPLAKDALKELGVELVSKQV